MQPPPRSKEFDDVYFSADDGLAETQHVFLDGNNLPEAWTDKEQFVIAETGFGTSLNFLSVWKLFEKTADAKQRLHYISVEKFPLKPEEIQDALLQWSGFFEGRLEKLACFYPLRLPGFHRVEFSEQVSLTLIFDDMNDALPRLQAAVDCWFLDGFKPSSNPEMWTETLYQEMARLSNENTTFATFTAAGDVKRGLQDAGFNVEKIKGFGRKREMLIGQFKQDTPHPIPPPSRGEG